MFQKDVRLRFHDIDSAKVIYFAKIFDLAHDLYEDFVQELGFTYQEWFESPNLAVPIVHAECDYKRPLVGGENYQARIEVKKVGESSMSLEYSFEKDSLTYARVETIHVFIDPRNQQKAKIPDRVREAFSTHLQVRP